jgi:Zn-dependent protease with chaperone function
MKAIGLTLGITLIIPLVGLLVSLGIVGWIDHKNAGDQIPHMALICSRADLLATPAISAACNEYNGIVMIGDIALWSGAIPCILLIIQVVGATIAGRHRGRMAFVFPGLTWLTMGSLIVTIPLQAITLIGAIYFGESYLFHRIHVGVIFTVGLGALVGVAALIQGALAMLKPPEITAIGCSLNPTDAPGLFSTVAALASKLGATPPKNIIVGLEPTFYVTSARVRIPGRKQPIHGETLFLSMPLMRLLNIEELSAVIGHELGHFRGQDTVYSIRFAPVYRGLADSLRGLASTNSDRHPITSLPAQLMLTNLLNSFSGSEAAVSRVREFEADRASGEVAPAHSLGTALVKVSLFAGIWSHYIFEEKRLIGKGIRPRNASRQFFDIISFDIAADKLPALIDDVVKSPTAHPIDTHPTVGARLSALGINADDIGRAALQFSPEPASSSLVADLEKWERDVTLLHQQWQVARAAYTTGDQDESIGTLIEPFYFLLAHFSRAAGSERAAQGLEDIEGIGSAAFSDFDRLHFRDILQHPAEWPTLNDIITHLCGALSENGCFIVLSASSAIADKLPSVRPLVEQLEAALPKPTLSAPVDGLSPAEAEVAFGVAEFAGVLMRQQFEVAARYSAGRGDEAAWPSQAFAFGLLVEALRGKGLHWTKATYVSIRYAVFFMPDYGDHNELAKLILHFGMEESYIKYRDAGERAFARCFGGDEIDGEPSPYPDDFARVMGFRK